MTKMANISVMNTPVTKVGLGDRDQTAVHLQLCDLAQLQFKGWVGFKTDKESLDVYRRH